jgi:predicted MFS family arabinose efflux permease
VFAINIVPIAITLWLLAKLHAPKQEADRVSLDVIGAVLCATGLGALVSAMIEQSRFGWSNPIIQLLLAFGAGLLVIFVAYEKRTKHPMLPLTLFKVRNFTVGNIATISIYAGLSIATFLLAVFIQQVGHFSALQAGLALMPVTLIMFILSPRFGQLAGSYGPRWFMAAGPTLAASGFLLMLLVEQRVMYWQQLLPGILVFGIGLSMTVSPLTSAVLGAIDGKQAGVASAVNNMIARVAGLLGIALIGLVTGAHLNVHGFHRAIIVTALLLLFGGVVSAVGIQNSAPIKE